jgi:hypothetical protein
MGPSPRSRIQKKPTNRTCSGSTLAHPVEEIQEGAISMEDYGFNFLG